MTTNDDQYVPTEAQVRAWCREGTGNYPDVMDEWLDRFLARVRRDAAREALDGLIAWHRENASDAETPTPIRRGIAVMADEAECYRDAHYPEETP